MSETSKHFTVDAIPDLTGKVVMVTGGNTGIGYEMCLELARKGAQVVMASRSADRAAAAIARIKQQLPQASIEFMHLQLSDLHQVQKASSEYIASGKPLNILINNAGIMASPFKLSMDGIEEQFATNHVGHFLLTTALLPVLLRSHDDKDMPRIVNVSSNYHNKAPLPQGIRFDKINDPGDQDIWQRYGQSKLSNILFSNALNKRYGDRIYINSVHPGFVKTELTRGPTASYGAWFTPLMWVAKAIGAISSQQGALTPLYAATSPDIVKNNAKNRYFVPIAIDSPEGLTDLAKSDDLAEQLWEFTDKLVKQKLGL
ncbi:hypothetical protein BDEG_20772 [Batrachochytrium dendrobatidis JEL423]|uniref:Uncharacterized protein n=1 Tax=Batrachochytrium dendrobatidis (strain JEL423) TaxID=403673 RepID=A0A177WA86_BATDL|nr:hypothetical protein BDEG_20772 [Batrachochytrium dendrobatidis JEL423]